MMTEHTYTLTRAELAIQLEKAIRLYNLLLEEQPQKGDIRKTVVYAVLDMIDAIEQDKQEDK